MGRRLRAVAQERPARPGRGGLGHQGLHRALQRLALRGAPAALPLRRLPRAGPHDSGREARRAPGRHRALAAPRRAHRRLLAGRRVGGRDERGRGRDAHGAGGGRRGRARPARAHAARAQRALLARGAGGAWQGRPPGRDGWRVGLARAEVEGRARLVLPGARRDPARRRRPQRAVLLHRREGRARRARLARLPDLPRRRPRRTARPSSTTTASGSSRTSRSRGARGRVPGRLRYDR